MNSDKYSLLGDTHAHKAAETEPPLSLTQLMHGQKVEKSRPFISTISSIQSHNTGNLFAAIDLGTNNCRLMIAEAQSNGSIHIQSTFSRLVRLGEGVQETGMLSEKAIARTIEALKSCVTRLNYFKIEQIRCIATAACRAASNTADFLALVKKETGLEFDVLSTEQEAYYAALSCAPLVPETLNHTIVLDIGGGSTEIVGLQRGQSNTSQNLHIQTWHSLPLGVVTLSEVFESKNFEENYAAMKTHVAGFMNADKFSAPHWQQPFELMGTSGTVTMLAGIYMNLPRYSKRRVDGFHFHTKEVRTLIKSLLEMSWQERAAIGCIGTQRVDLILSGCAILEVILDHFPTTTIRVADRGLREGVLYEMMYNLSLTHNA